MTNEQIIEMAKQAGFDVLKSRIYPFAGDGHITKKLQAFAQLVRNAALEECAEVCGFGMSMTEKEMHIAEQIRSLKS